MTHLHVWIPILCTGSAGIPALHYHCLNRLEKIAREQGTDNELPPEILALRNTFFSGLLYNY
ncbi:hypothetical protein OUZ56_031497 [Daphnia magna]|uniref:Uncharacterized protein n=1 Tax=Daphnia magna TaxID=35525 RepID=A0ABQ9ZV76_9CRUS|nr:hypothetical protein OUZ56_031497 [Daphnia magna]